MNKFKFFENRLQHRHMKLQDQKSHAKTVFTEMTISLTLDCFMQVHAGYSAIVQTANLARIQHNFKDKI